MRLRLRPFDSDVGLVLASFVVLLGLESLVVGLGARDELAGPWETANQWRYAAPFALAAAIPLALLFVALARLVAARRAGAVAFLAASAGAIVAVGVSTGRLMTSTTVRVPFVVVVASIAGGAALVATRRAPLHRPFALAAAGAVVAVAAWTADAFVLPRLYPAFHAALFVITLAAWAALVVPLRKIRVAPAIALAGIVTSAASLAWAPRAARALSEQDNLRRVLVEHAPVFGRSVELAARVSPPAPLEDDGAGTAMLTSVRQSAGKTLDWTGRDIVLVTIDALRADHVSSYGYVRPTTPNIDRLAASGVRFERAYCPTPHTSYSVTSMMTGTYMRPLLAMGAGDDAETWAGHLRRYGFRTAAFYPPAVFFIDEHRFRAMKERGLGFEYKKEEFAKPELRRAQIAEYLASAPTDRPLFLWVHLFEPHEPYEMHAAHPFSGDERFDAYDSEIAAADALVGDIAALIEERRPGATMLVSADHGEEHGDHGGRYHGTTVYEEQVRVPLVIAGPGISPRVIAEPVQTIDLLPTTLAALDIPLSARLRGRDLGPIITGAAKTPGLAFAETDDYMMVARSNERLVCARKAASCTLFDLTLDPAQKRPIEDRPQSVSALRSLLAAIEQESGRLETNGMPMSLRRCLQGDRESEADIAFLLADAKVEIRRATARCTFRIRAEATATELRRAAERDEDEIVRQWSRAALLRIEGPSPGDADLLRASDPELRAAIALALAEHGDGRGEGELARRWEVAFVPGARDPGELDEAREILAAFAKLRSRAAVPGLVRSLDDVRLRPFVVDALGAIGDPRAKAALLETFAEERYVHVRAAEARALLKVGAKDELRVPLARFAGVPEPMPDALAIAAEAGVLRPEHGGWSAAPEAQTEVEERVKLEGAGPARLLVWTTGAGTLSGSVDGEPITASPSGDVWSAELADVAGPRATLSLAHPTGIRGVWLVRRAPEIPPPPPQAWEHGGDAGTRFDAKDGEK